jgi:hypothetical protein
MYMAIWVRVFNGTFTIVVMCDQFYAPYKRRASGPKMAAKREYPKITGKP